MTNLYALCAGGVFVNYIVDVFVVATLIVSAFVGAKKGFVNQLFGFIATIVAAIIAIACAKLVVNLTGGFFGVEDSMRQTFVEAFAKIEGFNVDISNAGLAAMLAEKNLPEFISEMVIETYGNENIPTGTTLASVVGGTLGDVATALVCGIALFFACRLVLNIFKSVLNSIVERIYVFGAANWFLGFAVGLIKSFLVVCLVLAILSVIPSVSIAAYLENSLFVGALYHNNPINTLLGMFIS